VRIVLIGAGQLGVTFCLLLDKWRQARRPARDIVVTLVDRAEDILLGATRASWINHATGFEYFKRGEVKTGRACVQGAIVKRLLLPAHLHDMPSRIRNRFFVAAESDRRGDVKFRKFLQTSDRVAREYRAFHARAAKRTAAVADQLIPPEDFCAPLMREHYYGVNERAVAGGVVSAGGVANMAMDIAFKAAALQGAMDRGTVSAPLWTKSIVRDIRETRSGVQVELGDRVLDADLVILCAAHGNSRLTRLIPGRDLSGAYHLNFMLHAYLPPTQCPILRDRLASVNFVLQGEHGGMYACILPPTEHECGFAAMFAPGESASYISSYNTRCHRCPTEEWDHKIGAASVRSMVPRVNAVLERIYRLNPFLRDYLRDVPFDRHRVAVGSVFNAHGMTRSKRRLIRPAGATLRRRVVVMTSPKWTTAELAGLTLLQWVLKRCAPAAVLPEAGWGKLDGFGPYGLDVLAVVPELTLESSCFDRCVAERYLKNLGLPLRILPPETQGDPPDPTIYTACRQD
jgi:hypothetical protein